MNKLILLACSGIFTMSYAQKDKFLNYPKVSENDMKKKNQPSTRMPVLKFCIAQYIIS
jgi:hypothetical protein